MTKKEWQIHHEIEDQEIDHISNSIKIFNGEILSVKEAKPNEPFYNGCNLIIHPGRMFRDLSSELAEGCVLPAIRIN